MPKCNFNEAANIFIEIKLQHSCSPVNLLHIFITPLYDYTSGEMLLRFVL